jgi:putative ABC transport system substrate-binding protein
MSYSANIVEQFRRAAVFVDKIFKGAKPSDLPVEQPTSFELIVNVKTARRSGSHSRKQSLCGRIG